MEGKHARKDARRPAGLDAGELGAVVAALRGSILGMTVRDATPLRGGHDLLVVLVRDGERRALHVGLGSGRARICTTSRRFPRSAFVTGGPSDRLSGALRGSRLVGVAHTGGERRCSLHFEGEGGVRSLHVELFGNLGLWCLADGDGRVLQLSRPARGLSPGSAYSPPSAPQKPSSPSPGRFTEPVLDSVDRHFTALDRQEEDREQRRVLERALASRRRKLESRIAGLSRQAEEIAGVDELRHRADLMLAHSSAVARGAAAMTVPDPDRPGAVLRFELDPARTVVSQAQRLYSRARKLEDAAAVSAQRRAQAAAELERVSALEGELACREEGALEELRERLEASGYLPRPRTPPAPKARKKPAEPFRRYRSREGHDILVGRNNVQNDRLSIQVARGNDLWFHVGGGRTGSHVVVRVPRSKTASLETLLDAGTLAVHFSKYRGSPVCEVIYARAKHVSKPKGLPPGRVQVTQTRSLGIRLEPDRLARLLGSSENS